MLSSNCAHTYLGLTRWSLLQCRRASTAITRVTPHHSTLLPHQTASLPSQRASLPCQTSSLPRHASLSCQSVTLPCQRASSPLLLYVRHCSSASTGLTPGTAFPLHGEAPRQFLTSDGETIVCIHPSSPVDISATKVSLSFLALGHYVIIMPP